MKFEGIYTPAITPYRDDGSIDRDAFVAQLEYLMASGVQRIINGGSTGEYHAQSMDERREMAGQYAGPPRPPLKPLNRDDKRQLEQTVRVLKTTIAQIAVE